MSVGGVTVDPDDDLGCCTLDLSTIEGDTFDEWLELKNIAHGKLHVRAQRFNPAKEQQSAKTLKSNDESVQMTQIWINQLQSKCDVWRLIYFLDIDITTTGYKDKKDVYTAKAILSDGTEYDFGVGAYEPHHEQNTVNWDMAMHHVSWIIFELAKLEPSSGTYPTWPAAWLFQWTGIS